VADGRHFPNTLSDVADAFGPGAEEVRAEVWRRLYHLAERCARKQPRRRDPSVYTGEGGTTLMFLKMALAGECDDPNDLLLRALDHVRRCDGSFGPRRVATFLEGRAGALTLRTVLYHRLGEAAVARRCAEELLALGPTVTAMPPDECEVLYGRCGFLYCILFLRKFLGDASLGSDVASTIVRQVTTEGLARGTCDMPLNYQWHGKGYLGAAHGLCGILLTLLHFPSELAATESATSGVLAAIRRTVDALLRLRFASGNLPSSLGSDRDKLVQWCHGAPGLVPLLLRCAAVYGAPHYLTTAAELGDVVWRRGLLTKGVGLCHGISGNGYALLALYRATGRAQWLHRAQQFLLFALDNLSELRGVPDHPHSLFEGLMGLVCFGVDVLHPDGSFFPGYETRPTRPPGLPLVAGEGHRANC